ncbi:hypothetical protein PRUB_a4424 [Pseudoalteromonas rubra]|uniref:Uncharacterized protein n=1 Tax=Pseudoalteromonas rubra TaxID=43658 RepID=A0A8T0C993_9GAMM|nr:hypothetical protein PRUB_a4424 [Pseudoalteromonas rubra]
MELTAPFIEQVLNQAGVLFLNMPDFVVEKGQYSVPCKNFSDN